MKLEQFSKDMQKVHDYITSKYYEVEDFSLCILLSLISRTNMIALGQPGIAKSAILREIVDLIDFSGFEQTPYFTVQMGADVSPNNIFGAPNIQYFKEHGILKRNYKGFLPDALMAFASEFYRLNDQVANSGLLTILNEGEFKNGVDTIKTNLRFFMADTNFFPRPADDLEAEERDERLSALHDRFLARVYVRPLQDNNHKIDMILMDDNLKPTVRIPFSTIITIQEQLDQIKIPRQLAHYMVSIANELERDHQVFISPRRLKLSRNMIRAHAVYAGRTTCRVEDLMALQYTFWQRPEDIQKVKDLIHNAMNKPKADAKRYLAMYQEIVDELDQHITNTSSLPSFDPEGLYTAAIKDISKLIELIEDDYHQLNEYEEIGEVNTYITQQLYELIKKREEVS